MGIRRRDGLQIHKHKGNFKYIHYFGDSDNGFSGLYIGQNSQNCTFIYVQLSYFNYTSIKLCVGEEI